MPVITEPISRGLANQSAALSEQSSSACNQDSQPLQNSPLRLTPIDLTTKPASSLAANPVKDQPKFALGGLPSCKSHRGRHQCQLPYTTMPQIKRTTFQIGGSSGDSESLNSATQGGSGPIPHQNEQESFRKYVDESAIDDDDDSHWEDSDEDCESSSLDETLFRRVPLNAHLTTRKSLITMMHHTYKLGKEPSKSTSAIHQDPMPRNGPSLVALPNDSDDSSVGKLGSRTDRLNPIHKIPRSAVNIFQQPAALSPGTTRRNMLAAELTESLRRGLVWERSQKSLTANAVLQRRHISQNVANLKQYPEQAVLKSYGDAKAGSCDFTREAFGDYHSKGW